MEILEILITYIIKDAKILIPALLVLGWILKNTPKVEDWLIPWILLIVGIIFALMIMGFTANALIQGILVVGAAVLIHQLYKQSVDRE